MTENVMITPFVNEGYNEQNVAYTEHMVEIAITETLAIRSTTMESSLAAAELSLQELADLLWQAGITLPSPTREKLQVGDIVVGWKDGEVNPAPFRITAIGETRTLVYDGFGIETDVSLSSLEGATVTRGDNGKKFVVTTDF